MAHLSSTQWATLGSIATVVSGGATIAGLVWRTRVGALLRAALHVLAWLDPLHSLKRDVAHITKELRPNGGSSLSDKVNAIWTRQGMTAARVGMLLDESEAMLWQSDLDGRQTWASRALIDATGRPLSELLGWGWLNAIHPGDRERIRKAWLSCLAEGRNFEDECRFQAIRGERYDDTMAGKLVAKPFMFDGRVIAWIGRATLEAPEPAANGAVARPSRRRRP